MVKRIIQDQYHNSTSKPITGDTTLSIDRNSGIGQVITATTTSQHKSHNRGHYKTHKGNKTVLDFRRYRKTMKSSLYNNYGNNDARVRFITLTFSDNRIKTVNGAKSKFHEYLRRLIKQREVECWSMFPEYNDQHKPHIHAIIKLTKVNKIEQTREGLINDWLVSEWNYGLATASTVWDVKGLANYLIPAYDSTDYKAVNDEMTADKGKMELATIYHHMAKGEQKRLRKSAPKWKKEELNHQRQKANMEKKKECQKQLTGNERAIYLSQGQAKTARTKTDNKAIHNLWRTTGSFAGSTTITTTINTYDNETGELIKSYTRKVTVDKYYFTPKQSATLYDLLTKEMEMKKVA